MSLDGYIADVDGGYGWIVEDREIDFAAFVKKIDTLLMGRGTYEVALESEGGGTEALLSSMKTVVVSTTLDPADHPDVTVISRDAPDAVRALKAEPGKDIWLFGGGVLFRAMLEAGLVDTVEIGVIPVLLGDGIPVLPGLEDIVSLELRSHERFASGIVLLKYRVRPDPA